MKKIVCPQCGLVNLEKFVSFPHCAACGARLPTPESPPARWRTLWKRPVKTLYVALTVGAGLGALALGVVSLSRETRQRSGRPFVVYARIPRELAPGKVGVASFTLDSAEENPDARFQGVQFNLSRETLREIIVVSFQPAPNLSELRGHTRYYIWESLPRGSALRLSFKPRVQSDVLHLRATLWATGYAPFEARSTIQIKALKSGQDAPKVSR